jgi:hypothetical protein
MSNMRKQIKEFGSRLKNLGTKKQVEKKDSNDRTDDVTSISESSMSIPTIVASDADSVAQEEDAFVAVSHTKYYAENGQAIPVAPISPWSPMNASNPHPCLSISTTLLQEAIKGCRKPGSWYERSILRREFVHKNEMGDNLQQRFFSHQDSSWRWTRFASKSAAHGYAPEWIYPGDVEVISIKNGVIRSRIQRKKPVFEDPANVGEVASTATNLGLDFSEPEKAGWRVLVWRVCGTNMNGRRYMDRQGRAVADPMDQRVTKVED